MAAPPPAGERRSSATVALADGPSVGRVSTLGALPSAAGAALQGGSVRSSTCAASVTWTECAEPDTGGSGLIGTLQGADGKSTATVTVRSPLGLVDYTQLNLVRELGRGCFGVVELYEWAPGTPHAGEPPVALKVLLPNVARDLRTLRDFAEEVALLSTLKHPHIVACYGAGLRPAGPAPGSTPVPFLCMEAVMGSDLRSLVTRATMEPDVYNAADVMRWAYQISSALNHLHTRSPMVIYRDLKLENVMLNEHWDVRLTDMGLAKVIMQDPSMRFGRYVMTGGTGSLKYMAPEMVKSNKANERVDQYSFAIVLWELLSRKGLLFLRTVRQPNGARVEMTPQMWAEEAMKGARPMLSNEWPEVLTRVLANCWHHEPLKRPRFSDVMVHLHPELKPELWTDPTKGGPAARASQGGAAGGCCSVQ